MVGFPKYESYKDSGVEWLGEIPINWNIERAKWLFKRMDRRVRKEDEVVTAFRDGEVTLRKNRREEGFTTALQEHGYQGIRKGDLVIHAMDAFAGAIGVSDSDGKSTPVYSVCTPRSEFYVNSYYYAYLLRYMARSGFIQSLAKGIRERSTDFRFNDFANLFFPIPSPEEQNRIVEFLDRKTAEIDQAIAQKQRLIELLQEQKAILINQAVTKGLDPNVPMCDRDVEWLGEIPSNWLVKAIKHISFVNPSGNRAQKEEQVTFLPMEAVLANGQYDVSRVDIRKAFPASLTEFNQGDVLLAKITPCFENGKGAFLEELPTEKGIGSTEFHVFRVDKKQLTPKFLYYAICSNGAFRTYAQVFMEGTAGQKRITTPFVSNTKMPVPSIEEQNRIVKFLERKTSEIDQVIAHEQRFIRLLQEQKTILISQAVTGKIKV